MYVIDFFRVCLLFDSVKHKAQERRPDSLEYALRIVE